MSAVTGARFGYLGPAGTFTEAALMQVPGAADAEMAPYDSVPAALEAVRRGDCDAAMVPMENSLEGAVTVTLDELATGQPLMITREVLLPVTFALLVRPGTDVDDVKTVASHPHGYAQTRRWIAATLPNAHWTSAASNADAARQVQSGVFDAALAGAFAAATYHLEVLVDGVHDIEGAVTRFVLVSRPTAPPPPTGADKTSLVAAIADDHPGALLEVLEEFAVRGVNLTRIESRPTGSGLGRYHFSIDCEGHVMEERVGEALMGLRRICGSVRFLGSYASADGVPPFVRSGMSDGEFRSAATWLGAIRTAGDPENHV